MAFLVYVICLVAAAAVMYSAGFGAGTWQYWVIWACVVMSNIAGRGQ